MEDNKIDRVLAKLSQKRLPDCPSNLEDNVLRRVRLQKSQSETKLIDLIYQHLFKTGVAIPVVALAIVFSSGVSSIAISQEKVSSVTAAEGLDFENIVEVNDILHLGTLSL